jgi:hypothetical protein
MRTRLQSNETHGGTVGGVACQAPHVFWLHIAVHDVDAGLEEELQGEQHLERELLDEVERHAGEFGALKQVIAAGGSG